MNIRRMIGVALSLALLAAISVGSTGTAFAAPGEPTSCMGHEAADISPPGSSTEEGAEGDMPTFIASVQEVLGQEGIGPFVGGVFAQLHEGSHEACDIAVEG